MSKLRPNFSDFLLAPYGGGGDVSEAELDDLLETDLADPGADRLVGWDESDTQFEFFVANTGLTISGNNLNVSGLTTSEFSSANVSQWTNDAGYITATLTEEEVEDFVGGMVTGNTETGLSVTYQDVGS